MATKLITPADLNTVFAAGSAQRATASAAVMSALYADKRDDTGAFGKLANRGDSDRLTEKGYSQTSQTLAAWATAGAMLAALPAAVRKPHNADTLADVAYRLALTESSVAKRAALVTEWKSATADTLAAHVADYGTRKPRARKAAPAGTRADAVKGAPKGTTKTAPASIAAILAALDAKVGESLTGEDARAIVAFFRKHERRLMTFAGHGASTAATSK